MQCPSAPINPRSAAASESTASASGCPPRSAEEFFNDVERRAEPVSPSSEPQAARPAAALPRRFRPRLPEGAAQQRPLAGSTVGGELAAFEPLRLRDPEAGRHSGSAQPAATAPARDDTLAAAARRLRPGHYGPAGSGKGELSRVAPGTDPAPQAGEAARRAGFATRSALRLICLYQKLLSPGLGDVCRFQPSCS